MQLLWNVESTNGILAQDSVKRVRQVTSHIELEGGILHTRMYCIVLLYYNINWLKTTCGQIFVNDQGNQIL